MTKTKVVYILGSGRSGSTLLGIIMGNMTNVFFGGELFAWFKNRGQAESQNKNTLKFWGNILERNSTLINRHSTTYFPKLENYLGLLNYYIRSDIIKQYLKDNERLFKSISNYTGAEIIVDSSHYPLRLFYLSKISKLDVSIVYLVRHPLDVINSFQKSDVLQPSKHPIQAIFYYFVSNMISLITFYWLPSKNQNKWLIRYEDIIEQNDKYHDMYKSIFGTTFKAKTNYAVGNIFEGNRIKDKESIIISNKRSDSLLSLGWRVTTQVVNIPFMIIFKYKWRV
jgi:hypothetical protein